MSKTATPELKPEHKIALLWAQRDVLGKHVAIHDAQKQLEQSLQGLNQTAQVIAQELAIDPSAWQLDLDALKIVPITKQ